MGSYSIHQLFFHDENMKKNLEHTNIIFQYLKKIYGPIDTIQPNLQTYM